MTRLRKMMVEELHRRNYSQHTTRYYIRTVEDFARHFNCPPDRLGLRHIREYQAELFQKRKLSPGSVANRLRSEEHTSELQSRQYLVCRLLLEKKKKKKKKQKN